MLGLDSRVSGASGGLIPLTRSCHLRLTWSIPVPQPSIKHPSSTTTTVAATPSGEIDRGMNSIHLLTAFSAASRLLATTELVEQILLGVAQGTSDAGGHGNLPPAVLALRSLPRVCRTFNRTIVGSLPLSRLEDLRRLSPPQDPHMPIDWLVARLGFGDYMMYSSNNNAGHYINAPQVHHDVMTDTIKAVRDHPKTFARPEASWRSIPVSLQQSPDTILVKLTFSYRKGNSKLVEIWWQFDQNSTLGEVFDKYMAAVNAYLIPGMAYDDSNTYNKKQRDYIANRVRNELIDTQY